MKCGTCSLTPVLALIGLVGLGVGGYNWVSTGCPLGSCSDSAAKVTATSADTKKLDGHCPLCPSEAAGAVTTVAHTTTADCSEAHDCSAEAKSGACCKDGTGPCCQEGAAAAEKTNCTAAAKSECPMMKDADKETAEKPKDTPETAPIKPS